MNAPQVYIIISLVVLLIIAAIIFLLNKNKKREKITGLTQIAFAFILAGIIFGNDRLIGYSLIGIGIIFAIIDIIKSLKPGRKVNH